jgi:hypothetical protein
MKLPPPLNWLYDGWMAFSKVLGRIMSFIILTILWITAFGIYSIIGKISAAMKKAPPDRGWLDVPPPLPDDLRRQF